MIRYHPDLIQGTEEWRAARCGLLTASEMKLIMTPTTLKGASNEKERAHLYELLAQRVTQYVEPRYQSDDMLRGQQDEVDARMLYHQHCHPVSEMGFITNDRWGFTLGYSPDAIVGDDGLLECKSRAQKFQVQTVIECLPDQSSPTDFALQIQTGLLVAERKWIDLVSYSGGMPFVVIRIYPDAKIQDAIVTVAGEFERRLETKLALYKNLVVLNDLMPTERRVEQEIIL